MKSLLNRPAWILRRPPTFTSGATSSARSNVKLLDPHRAPRVGGQRMTHEFHHIPVMRDEVVALFHDVPSGVVIDATLGGGGHSSALLAARSDIAILGIDRDEVARRAATEKLASYGERVRIVPGTFGDIDEIVTSVDSWLAGRPIVGVLLDLGVSSPQLDDPERGFSFRHDAALDMRMNPASGATAAELLAVMDVNALCHELRNNGEGRFAMAIARSLKASLPTTTTELVAAVEAAVPPSARRRGHVAARTFQALRILVNGEMDQLTSALPASAKNVAVGGVIAVLSYHSGEDRVTKEFFALQATGGCVCPPVLGCVCGAVPKFRVLRNSAVLPSEAEVTTNPRARSARLRAAWKVSE